MPAWLPGRGETAAQVRKVRGLQGVGRAAAEAADAGDVDVEGRAIARRDRSRHVSISRTTPAISEPAAIIIDESGVKSAVTSMP